jgi:hypothetical protein
MMDDFTKRMVELYRQDLRDMANGTYVPPLPHHSMMNMQSEEARERHVELQGGREALRERGKRGKAVQRANHIARAKSRIAA